MCWKNHYFAVLSQLLQKHLSCNYSKDSIYYCPSSLDPRIFETKAKWSLPLFFTVLMLYFEVFAKKIKFTYMHELLRAIHIGFTQNFEPTVMPELFINISDIYKVKFSYQWTSTLLFARWHEPIPWLWSRFVHSILLLLFKVTYSF